MFTGIISAKSKVLKLKTSSMGMELVLMKPKNWKIKVAASVAVNGVCSTVKGLQGGMKFDYMPESLGRTNLTSLKIGDTVNLERPMGVSDTFDGHIVQGHIDAVGKIVSIVPEGNSYILKIKFPKQYTDYVVDKGSIALEGISLTVAETKADWFTVKIIPFTWEKTNLSQKKVGGLLNLEFDILAKYLVKIMYANKK